MNLEFTESEVAFQREIRAWFEQAVPADLKKYSASGQTPGQAMQQGWEAILGANHGLVVTWPANAGGPGWSATKRYIFDLERARAGAPPITPFGVSMVGPVLYTFGTPAQKEQHLPGIAKGTVHWCQGYSEPNAGSDLAALKTAAVRDGDDYVVNGQKIWTSLAHWADWCFCLVRTDSSGKQQAGISFLLIDMKTPGITIRPIITIDGRHHVNEVYFTDVRVPAANLVGTEGAGWSIAKFLLTHERTNIAGVADSKFEIERLRTMLQETPQATAGNANGSRWDDAFARRRVAELEIDLAALEYTNFRVLAATEEGKPLGAQSSGLKIKGTELQQAITQAMVELGGHLSLTWQAPATVGNEAFNHTYERYNFLRAATIYGGSNEIQKNVIAKMLLGL